MLTATTIKADPSGNIITFTDVRTQPDNGGGTLGSTIQILDEDGNVVFSTYIYVEGDIELPATLTDTYTIEVIRGSQTFVGEIDL